MDISPKLANLSDLDVSRIDRFLNNTHWSYFSRLRRESPVHYCAESPYGPYWSITRYDDILAIDKNHHQFSSAGNVIIGDVPESFNSRAFMVADPPVHTRERKAILPAVSPRRLAMLEELIRSRICAVLDALPRNETFDWSVRVSGELTTQMVATLFDFPWAERHLLPYWSDVIMETPRVDTEAISEEHRQAITEDYLARLRELWRSRAESPPRGDFISCLAHNPATSDMIDDAAHLIGTVTLLIGANDTTRSSISGGIVAFNQFPEEWQKLRADTSLIPNVAAEIVRWQTPLSHMRRTATEDVEFQGKLIRKNDRVVMWYCSGNRDESVFDEPDAFRIERPNARRHLSYGYGIHRCVGRHVAELQLRILWEEILKRFEWIELMAEPKRTASNFFAGYDEVLAQIR